MFALTILWAFGLTQFHAIAPATVGRRFAGNTRRRRVLHIPRPRDYQADVLNHAARFKVVSAGRRWGKSTAGLVACLIGHGPVDKATGLPKFKGALHGATIYWVVPDYPTSGHDRWRDLKRATRHVRTSKSEQEHRVGLPGGGSITIKTADDPDSLRGPGLDGAVLDEAPLMQEIVWTEVLRAALADRKGWALFLSTPRGRANWFYKLWLRGLTDEMLAEQRLPNDPRRKDWASWQRPSTDNPAMTEDELDSAKLDLGSLKFSQEYLAEFIVAGGAVIKRQWLRYYTVTDAGRTIVIEGDSPRQVPVAMLQRWATSDLAVSTKTTADYTVIGTFASLPTGELLLLDLVRDRMEGPDIVPAMVSGWQRHRWFKIGIESVQFQLSVVQAALRRGLPAKKLTPEGDKHARAVFLSARCEGGMFFLPREADFLMDVEGELVGYPEAPHDDILDVCAYAAIEAMGGTDDVLHTQ